MIQSPAMSNTAHPFIISYDKYEDSKNGQRYQFDRSVSLPDYLRESPFSFRPVHPEQSVGVTKWSLDHLPGEMGHHDWSNCQVASESGKRFTRSMLDNMNMLEHMGECLEPFSIDNIRERDGLCVFYNVTRIPLDNKKLEGNYKTCKQILDTGFKVNNKLPEDIEHLLDMMESSFEYRSLFRFHASLWTLSERAGKFMQMHDKLKALPGGVCYNIYCAMGKLPYIANWRTDVTSNELLDAIYSADVNGYKLIKLSGPNAMLHSEGSKFTNYLRNRIAHKMKHLRLCKSLYTAQGSELTALVRWPKAYAILQFELFMLSVKAGQQDLDRGRLY